MEDFEGKEDDVEGEDADAMDMDTPTASKNPNSKVPSEVKERVMKVLQKVSQQREFGSLRAAKLTQDDFLLLLSYFNEAGFHFA